MANQEKIVTEIATCCVLLSFLVAVNYGLDLSMDRTPGHEVCGHLQCLNDVTKDGNIFTTLEISVYDVTQADNKIKLASVSMNAGGQYVEHTNSNHINGTGTISRYHAGLTLDFRNETDCLYGSFQCQLDFVNMTGLIDVMHKTVTPKDQINDPSCALVSYQLQKLKVHSEELEKELTTTTINNSIMADKLTATEKELYNLRYNITAMGSELTIFRELKVKLDKYFQDVLRQIATFTCGNETSHSNSRDKFTLQDSTMALCDTETDGGGWIVIQRRTEGDVDFYRDWNDYKKGFGTLDTDFWIGNDLLHNLTSQGYTELRVDMEYNGRKYFAHYSNFSVGDEVSKYKLSVSGYSGTAGDSLAYHDGMMFSTFDRDNDKAPGSCAQEWVAGWWYNYCHYCNLNGRWLVNGQDGVVWKSLNYFISQTATEMKIRHI